MSPAPPCSGVYDGFVRITSIKLFNAWTEKNRQVVAAQERLDRSQAQGDSADVLAKELRELRAVSEKMLADAFALFNEELRLRGIR